MAPRVNVFKHPFLVMRLTGLRRPEESNTLDVAISYLVLFISFVFIITNFWLIFIETSSLLRLDNLAITLGALSIFYKVSILTLNKSTFFSLTDRINYLFEENEHIDGLEVLVSLNQKSTWAHIYFSASVTFVSVTACCTTYFRYYYLGVKDAKPFEVYTPFGPDNIHATVWYQTFVTGCSMFSLVYLNSFFTIAALSTSTLLNKLSELYKQVNRSNVRTVMKDAVHRHAEIIKIVEQFNSMFSITFLIDYFFAMCYTGILGYLLVKFGQERETFLKRFLIFVFSLLNASYFCLGGHLISSGNDKLYHALYDNKWYELSPKIKKDFLLPTMMASKRLSWNMKGAIYFDMSTYLFIVQQSYSFITLLNMMV